jgi:NitT/TauT family transport system permease protein
MSTMELTGGRRLFGGLRLRVRALQVAAVLAVLGGWTAASETELVAPTILPPPHLVAEELVAQLQEATLWRATWVTVIELVVALVLATGIGVIGGFLLSRSVRVARAVEPLLAWGYIFPFALLYPLFVMWFGAGPESKVAYALANGVFPIAFNTMRGLSNIDEKYLQVAKAYRASKHQIDWHIKIGAAWPMILAGIRIGAGMVMVTVVLGEVLGADAGLGFEIQQAVNTFQIVKSYAFIVFLIALTAAMLWAIERLLRASRYT